VLNGDTPKGLKILDSDSGKWDIGNYDIDMLTLSLMIPFDIRRFIDHENVKRNHGHHEGIGNDETLMMRTTCHWRLCHYHSECDHDPSLELHYLDLLCLGSRK
jgi:hypothetical protein